MDARSYLYVALATTFNILLNAITFGYYIWLEGRVSRRVFRNWARRYRYEPRRFVQPTSEAEIVELVKSSKGLRVYGSGHSFNDGVVADDILVSLDMYRGLVAKDLQKKQLTVMGGTRVREITRALLDDGLAFAALPSHDAQSIAGILSTDVHGTGRDWGFVSQSVVRLKLIDGNGEVHECRPEDDLFKAAIGGVGAVGIISEVTVQAVDRFNIEQEFRMSDLSYIEANIDRILEENDHFSLYLFPFSDVCQIGTWNRTEKGKSPLGPQQELLSTSLDALMATWIGNLGAYKGWLSKLPPRLYSLKLGTHLVMESHKAHNRTIYPLHQEMEFAVPYEDTFEMCRRFLHLYEELYPTGLPYLLFEVRFTPAGHDRTLIGPGRERRSTWIDLICADSTGFEKLYAAAEEVIKETGARPHLGKWNASLTKEDMLRLHQDHFTRFLELVEEHDPEGKFANAYSRRLFGLGS